MEIHLLKKCNIFSVLDGTQFLGPYHNFIIAYFLEGEGEISWKGLNRSSNRSKKKKFSPPKHFSSCKIPKNNFPVFLGEPTFLRII